MARIVPATAKKLCTATEYRLVGEASPRRLPTLSEKALRAKIVRARTLRDKWRDLATAQRRAGQRAAGSREAADVERSREKQQLFAEVLARFEAQLQKVVRHGEPDKARTPLRTTPSKATRNASHREQRSVVRKSLHIKKATLEKQSSPRGVKASGK